MGDFGFYLREGFYHITDWKGYDHILFVLALCVPYAAKNWRQVLILITAFTVGHSMTLALSVFNMILIPSAWIEFLIPITILITALENVRKSNTGEANQRGRYATALVFGLIHGMGFSNYLKSMLGKDESIVTQLLAFNVGLELGQLLIVAAVFALTFVFVQLLNIKRRDWTIFVSGGIFGISFIMALERLPF
jgi:hypothetical protein